MRSGYHVAGAAQHLGHDVTEVDVDKDLATTLGDADVVFIALHGRDGEDGTLQLVCESLGVAYTGSPPLTCRFCFDKGLTKGVLEEAGLPTPDTFVLPVDAVRHMGASAALRQAAERLGFPLVIKPSAQGSALGLAVVAGVDELSAAALGAYDHGDRILIERFVDGTDISVVVRGDPLEIVGAVEVRTNGDVFDFETRVSPGTFDYVPASIDARAESIALEAANLLKVRDFGRIDLRVAQDGSVFVLDVKTCPGLTETSIVPFAASNAGIGFDAFIGSVIDAALSRSPRVAQ